MLEQLNMNSVITRCDDLVRDKEVHLGVVMIGAGLVAWLVPDFGGHILVAYGLIQLFWKRDEIIQTIEEHHHHHHHNNNKLKKKAPRKKNG